MASIELKNLSKSFNTENVVDKISISVADGEFLVLVGPSGCGKSTLLRMIAGLEKVTEGDIFFDGELSTDRPPRDRDIAMVFQNYALYPHMTVGQNLGFALKVRNISKEEIANRVKKIATTLKLETLLDRKPRELSGGQRQRVAMGRAMIREPAVYLMDEPLSNLDTKLRVAMRTALLRLRDQLRVTTVYVTHDQLEALTLGDRVAVMRDGVLQQIDTPHKVFHRPSNVFVAGFIGSPSINLVEAKIADGFASFGQFKVPIGAEWNLRGRTSVILGLRPSDFERAESANENLVVLSVEVEVVEDLGTEINLLFS
ncbi:MAG: sn-glycerol-3-phosphate ABC transporter ATP-binding protein UgpC, partial [Gammaproteobacteria bacterium]